MPGLPFTKRRGQGKEGKDPPARAFPVEAYAFRPASEEIQVQGMREDVQRVEPLRCQKREGHGRNREDRAGKGLVVRCHVRLGGPHPRNGRVHADGDELEEPHRQFLRLRIRRQAHQQRARGRIQFPIQEADARLQLPKVQSAADTLQQEGGGLLAAEERDDPQKGGKEKRKVQAKRGPAEC